jgi:hypothetical protein
MEQETCGSFIYGTQSTYASVNLVNAEKILKLDLEFNNLRWTVPKDNDYFIYLLLIYRRFISCIHNTLILLLG